MDIKNSFNGLVDLFIKYSPQMIDEENVHKMNQLNSEIVEYINLTENMKEKLKNKLYECGNYEINTDFRLELLEILGE